VVPQALCLEPRPDFTVMGDPLERRGAITARPPAGDAIVVLLVL
jgi:hypothetical protein